MKKKKSMSAALAFVKHAWDETASGSWERLNVALRGALMIAIDAGMKFDVDDFAYLSESFNLGRWVGDMEWAYTHACGGERGTANPSAVQAIEKHRGRKPFLWAERTKTPTRLHVGAKFTWKGERVEVTSFQDAKGILIACSYGQGYDDQVGECTRFAGSYRLIEARADLPDGSIAVRFSAPFEEEGPSRKKPKHIYKITADELAAVRREYDDRRRKYEKAIASAETLAALEEIKVAANAEGPAAYRHFDLDILRDALDVRQKAIREAMSEAEWRAEEAARKKHLEEHHAANLARWVVGEDVRDFLHTDIRLRRKGNFIEVSNGNKVSLDAARLALAFVKRNRKKGWEANGQKFDVDAFPMRSISKDGVQIGCTLIPWSEVDRVEGLLSESHGGSK